LGRLGRFFRGKGIGVEVEHRASATLERLPHDEPIARLIDGGEQPTLV
jgi:hypothetical protein